MFLIIVGVIALCVFGVFKYFEIKYSNPYKLYLVFGKKGSGKTTFLIKKAKKFIKKGWVVYTNIPDVSLPGIRIVTDEEIKRLGIVSPVSKSVLIIDEINLLWDNRDFKSFSRHTSAWFRLQRHYRCYVYCASQTFDCDKKIRDQVDGMYLCQIRSNFISVAKKIYKAPKLKNSELDDEGKIIDTLTFYPFWEWCFTLIPRYRKYFNSFDAPSLPEMNYVER